jgi:hypothetical protein
MSKFFTLSALALATSLTSLYGYSNECKGELYGMNSGRGDTGILFQIKDQLNEASIDSVSKFSSAAVAYDPDQDRIFYVSAPRTSQYSLDISKVNFSEEQKKNLPIYGSRFKFTKLAYYDFETKTHTEVGKTKSVHTLVFDEANNRLIGSSSSSIYEINPQNGEFKELANFGRFSGKYYGDLTFYDNELLLVTSNSVYKVDTSDFSIEKLSKHGLNTVTGSAVDHEGNLIISRTRIGDQGYLNKTQLFKLNPYSGKTCLVSELPIRLNDLTTNTNQSTACYSTPICDTEDPAPADPLLDEIITDQNLLSCLKSTGNNNALDVKEIRCREKNIQSTDGIEYLANLRKLNLEINNISEINVSKNTNLEELRLSYNSLAKINLTNNIKLNSLYLIGNKLTEVDVSKNTDLRSLFLSTNNLTELDTSNNKELLELWLYKNKIQGLDISDNKKLERLNVSYNQLADIDVSVQQNLRELWLKDNQLTEIDVSNNTQLEKLSLIVNQISEVDLSNLTSLETLYLDNDVDCSGEKCALDEE